MPTPRRSMRDIKTISGKVDRIANPYMAYMQITCLEMEKARRGRERASALHRIGNLDGRIRDIDAEKGALLRALAERGAAPGVATPSAAGRPTPPRSGGGFKLRY